MDFSNNDGVHRYVSFFEVEDNEPGESCKEETQSLRGIAGSPTTINMSS
jgi:hypothetical protein